MGIHNLSSDVRGFLYTIFHEASKSFKASTKMRSPGLAVAVIPPPGSLAGAFRSATFLARRGTLQEIDDVITNIVEKIAATTDPDLLDQIEGARLREQLCYRGPVRHDKQLQADLGTYSANIF